MKYKLYPEIFWTELKQILAELKKNKTPLVALFDADGTLWDTDLGENLFQYTIDNRLVKLPSDPWNYYQALKKNNSDPRSAYLWLAQIYEGQTLEQVRTWAAEAFNSLKPFPIFNEQKKVIATLLKNNVRINIVTASIAWAVQPGAALFDLDDSAVIGVETLVENGIITDKQNGVITYKEGKVEAYKIRDKTIPFFASGNSEGDIALLEYSSHIRLAVSAANREDRLYKSEYQLQQIAKDKNWFFHRFI